MDADSLGDAPSGRPGSDAPAQARRGGDSSLQRAVDRFERRVIDDPGAPVADEGGDTLSRSELWLAAGLAASEIRSIVGRESQVVAVHLPGGEAWLVVFLAVLRAGHLPVTLPTAATVEEVAHVVETVEPALVISMIQDPVPSPDPADLQAAARSAGAAFALVDAASYRWISKDAGDFELAEPETGG